MMKLKLLTVFMFIFLFFGTFNIQCLDVYEFSFNGKKYEIVKEKSSWSEAASIAVSRGGYLVQIDSKAENDAIYNAITQGAKISSTYTFVMDGGGVAYLWIGATDKWEEGKWIWDGDNDGEGENFWNGQGIAGQGDGKPVSGFFVNWGGASNHTYAEPDNFNNNQDAAAIALEPWPKGMGGLGIAGEWNDIAITNTIYFIIEFDEKVEAPKLESPVNNAKNVDRRPTFVWKPVDADEYHIMVSKMSDFSDDILIDESSIHNTSYTPVSEFEAGIKVYWKVKAKKGTKESDWSQIWSFTVKDMPPPEKPTLVSPANGAEDVDTLPLFIWNKVEADSYHLLVSLTEDFSTGNVIDVQDIQETLYKPTIKLSKGQKYYWKVRGFKKNFGEWSDVWNFKVLITKPEPVELFLPPNKAEDVELRPLFKFSLVPDVDFYKLIISKNSDLSIAVLTHTLYANLNMDTLRIEEDLEQDTKYYWSINTINAAGETQGPIWEFKTKSLTGISQDLTNNDLMRIYPNPADDKVVIDIADDSRVNLLIYNSLGALVESYDIIGNQFVLDIKKYPVGVYFVYLKDENGKLKSHSIFIKK